MQSIKRVQKFVGSRIVESSRHIYIANPGLDHIGIGNRRLRHYVAGYLDSLSAFIGGAFNRNLHGRTAWSANLVAHFQRGLARGLHLVHGEYSVAKTQACSGSRRVLKCRGDEGIRLLADYVVIN